MTMANSSLRIGSAIATLLLMGCAAETPNNTTAEQPLWQTYLKLADELEGDRSFTQHEHFLAAPLLDIIQDAPREDRHALIQQVAVPLWLQSVDSHFENKNASRDCLVVNGTSVEGDPISAAIEYEEGEAGYKMRAVEIQFFNAQSEWPNTAWCPVRPETFQ